MVFRNYKFMINEIKITKQLRRYLLNNYSNSKSKSRTNQFFNINNINSKILLNKSASNLFSKTCNKHIRNNSFNDKEINNEIFEKINKCPGLNLCKNNQTIRELEYKISKLKSKIEDLNKMNEYFIFIINQKDKMYSDLIKENLKLKKSHISNNFEIIKYEQIQKKEEKKNIESLDSTHTLKHVEIKFSNLFNKKAKQFLKHRSVSNINESKSNLNITNNLFLSEEKFFHNFKNPYSKILDLSNKNNNKFHSSNGISLLSFPNEKLDEMSENENLNYLIKLTQSDELFINEIRAKTNKFLMNLCDIINMMAKDYQQSIRLIKRIKLFINSGVNLVKSILNTDSIKILLDNTCNILECEKVFLFIYDNLSEQLVLLNENANKSNNIKFPKDKGILGSVFLKKEKLKIDDTNKDINFFQELKKKLGFKIKNILCYPILDSYGKVFGIIQAINKRKKHFNCDDEELLLIISKQANAIIESNNNKDMNLIQISRLKLLFKYSIDLYSINNLIELTKKTEELLINLFSSSSVRILFKNENNKLDNLLNNQIFNNSNLGIIYYVFNNKQYYGCRKIKECKYYNSLIDIPASECIVTFPIFNGDECVGIIQTMVNCDLNSNNNEPKENEKNIFILLLDLISIWYKRIINN